MNKLIRAIVQSWLSAGEDIIVGGQAVIEGVMMRSPNAYAVAIRKKNGEIIYKGDRVPRLGDKYPILKLPILRGAATLLYSMALGIKTLNFSATAAFEDQPEDEKDASKIIAGHDIPVVLAEKETGKDQMSGKAAAATATGSILFALVFNILLFIVLPLLVTNAIFGYGAHHAAIDPTKPWYSNLMIYLKPVRPSIAFNLVDGTIRMGLFLVMIYCFSRLKDIHRVFQYHGAEHKVVFNYESSLPLTVANARTRPRQHPRCGTSFLMVVMLVAIVMFSIVKFDSLLFNFLARILLIPIIAGLSYEIIRASAKRSSQWLLKVITLPGLWLQNITTQEPADDQLEVAIFALEKSLALEPVPEIQIAAEPAVV
ncbi:MAG TPA: DUF1385 domain-containing protein [Blastocatellia bacterium]|nr:DUF1385 domain-containing protein [Blastocatellia bacterium]